MKKILLTLILLISVVLFSACSSFEDSLAPPELLRYSKVIEYPQVSQDELYTQINAWFVEAFNSAESVIEYSDKEAGVLFGYYTTTAKVYKNKEKKKYDYREERFKSVIKVEAKDGKIRITFCRPEEEYMLGRFMPVRWSREAEAIHKEWIKFTEHIEKYTKSDEFYINDEW